MDRFQEEGCPDASPAQLRIHQHHANPRETVFIDDRGHRTRHPSILLRDETSFGASLKKSFPIFLGLIPSYCFLQAHSGRDVARRHYSDPRRHKVKELFLDLRKSDSCRVRIPLFRKEALDFVDAKRFKSPWR